MKRLVLISLFLATFNSTYTQNSQSQIDPAKTETKKSLETSNLTLPNHNLWNQLLSKHVSDEGNVDYIGFKTNYSDLQDYIYNLSENTPDESWPEAQTLVYWINAYNALTIDLIVRNYPVKSIKDIEMPWKQKLWQLGDTLYNLDEIEHDIVRKMGEPRIHFALVCAAQSCPKLYNRAFKAETLDDDLSRLTREFLNDTSKNTISENELRLSKIFQWFTKDFKTEGTLIDFLNQYTDVEISKKAKKRFNDYNWDLNE